MSRKSISIVMPQKGAAAQDKPSNVTPILGSRGESRVDHWVRQDEAAPAAAPAAPDALTFTIPAEPDWMDLTRIGLVLPQMAFWYWTINAAKKNLSLFLR
jgi:hypothetical protein